MQEDAAVRVREMKRRAAIAVEEDNDKTEPEKKNVIPDEVKHISYPVEIEERRIEHENEECEDNQTVISDKAKSDGDSMLILLILILISRDEADPLTSLALLYLLL